MTKGKPTPPQALNQGRPPGWYTQPVRAWFGADWKPATSWGENVVVLSARARAGREARLLRGEAGSVVGLSKNNDARLAELSGGPGCVSRGLSRRQGGGAVP